MSKRLVEFVSQAYIDEKLAELRAIEAPAMITRGEALALLRGEIVRLASKGHSTADILKRLNSGAQVIRKADIDAMLSKSPQKPRAARKRAATRSASAQDSHEHELANGLPPAHEVAATGTQSAHPPNDERHDDGAHTAQERSAPAPQTGRIQMPTDEDDEC